MTRIYCPVSYRSAIHKFRMHFQQNERCERYGLSRWIECDPIVCVVLRIYLKIRNSAIAKVSECVWSYESSLYCWETYLNFDMKYNNFLNMHNLTYNMNWWFAQLKLRLRLWIFNNDVTMYNNHVCNKMQISTFQHRVKNNVLWGIRMYINLHRLTRNVRRSCT